MPPAKKSSSPSLKVIGVCLGYEVKTTKTGGLYADVQIRDEAGKMYRCKMWNWSDGFRQYLYPRKYVIIADMTREDYQGNEQYIIKDIQIDTDADIKLYDSSYIDCKDEYGKYMELIAQHVIDEYWLKIISKILSVNEVSLMCGIVDDRLGGNQTGSLIRTIRRITGMALNVADTIREYPIDKGYMCYAALVSGLARGAAYEVGTDGNVTVKEETNFFGVIGLPIMSMPKLFACEELKEVPPVYMQLMAQGLLSTTTSGTIGGYPAIFSNTMEGRILYHCASMERTCNTMEQYILGSSECMVAIPELVERIEDRNIKFIVPKRLISAMAEVAPPDDIELETTAEPQAESVPVALSETTETVATTVAEPTEPMPEVTEAVPDTVSDVTEVKTRKPRKKAAQQELL